MIYLLILVLTFFISQTLKFIIRYFSSSTKIDRGIVWTYIWATGAPSTHSAMLVAGLTMLYRDTGFSALFAFCVLVAGVFMYNLVADRTREIIEEKFFAEGDEAERKIVATGRVLDISGHSFFDIITGIITGFVSAQLLLNLLQ